MGKQDVSRCHKQEGRANLSNKPCLFVRIWHPYLRTLDYAPDHRKAPPHLMCVVSREQKCSSSTTHHPASRDRSASPTLVTGRSAMRA